MDSATRRYHHGDLRAALLERAERTLAEKGVGALSLRELARGIGVSHAAPNRHFRDKRELLDALALVGFQRLGAGFDEVARTGAFADQLVALGTAYVGFAVDNPELFSLMWAREHEVPELREAAYLACAAPMTVITEAQSAGEVIQGDGDRIGRTVFALLHGFAGLAASGMLAPDHVAGAIGEGISDLMNGLRPPE